MTFPEVVGLLLAATVILAVCWTVVGRLRSRPRRSGLPRVRARPLPNVSVQARMRDPVSLHPPQLVVAGRTYDVTEEEDPTPAKCPWCLGSLDGEPADEIVRCDQPYCGRAAHRRHNQEHGGCGGICSVVRA